jgi:hypothetical protein
MLEHTENPVEHSGKIHVVSAGAFPLHDNRNIDCK